MSLDTFGDVNYLAVIVGALVYFGIGALWYSPALFATPWMAASGAQPGNRIPVGLFGLSLVLEFLAALGLAVLAVAVDASTVGDGLLLGLVAGIAFAISALAVTQAYERRPFVLQLINGGYHVLSLAAIGVLVAVWR